MRSGAEVREAPPPHLRDPADPGSDLRRLERSDPVPNPAAESEVSLGGILAFADQRSPVLTVARSTRSRAEAARVAASILSPTNPEVSVAAGPRFSRSGTGIDVDVTVMQQIQIAGERGLRLDVADALRDLTNAEIEQMRWAVHCDVHAAFHRALVEKERARLAERVATFQHEVLRVVQRQISAGETAPLALRLAQAEVAQAKQVAMAARQAFFASRLRLAQLSGWPVATPPNPSGALDRPRDPPPLDRLSAIARRYLPSLRASAARIQEAEARSALADRKAWPRPSLGAQYRHEGTIAEGPSNIVMGVVSIPIPTFQRNQGEHAMARADVTIAKAELDAALRVLDGQIAEARSEVVAAAARTRAYGTEILPRFEENLTLLQRSFELGEIDILALSTGRERFLRIQSDALGAQQDYFLALAGLERVVGVELWRDDHQGESTP
ncbi:MAG: TolC family protein [Polyangiaceae bacterium]|nr:TolC family protein [Polyangiaceae bacterium]